VRACARNLLLTHQAPSLKVLLAIGPATQEVQLLKQQLPAQQQMQQLHERHAATQVARRAKAALADIRERYQQQRQRAAELRSRMSSWHEGEQPPRLH
jgi:hypothetical protein